MRHSYRHLARIRAALKREPRLGDPGHREHEALAHALRFGTWRPLAREGLDDPVVVSVTAGMIESMAE